MAFIHGKSTYISLNAVDLSAFCDTSSFERGASVHTVTTYGKNAEVHVGGLLKGTASISGTYDDGATGPRDTIEPLIGATVTLIRRPEGTGTGKPQDSVSVVVEKYVESSPVGDMVKWSCELTLSDDVTSTNQA